MSVTVILDEPELERVCKDLKIDVPPIRFKSTPDELVYGKAYKAKMEVEIRVGLNELRERNLRHVKSQLERTLLHELRHIWQFKYHPDMITLDMETDARLFEDQWVGKYRLVERVNRKVVPIAGLRALSG